MVRNLAIEIYDFSVASNINRSFFSVYIWNLTISLEIAKRFKEIKKDAIIVFGGPQVPETPQNKLKRIIKAYKIDSKSAKWIAADALKELKGKRLTLKNE